MDAYSRISKYKSHLMGIAMMIVIYGHFLYYHANLMDYAYNHFTIWYTFVSVELFMLVSGFGIFISLRKNPEPYGFYSRRILRLIPAYIPMMTVWVVFNMLTNGMRIGEAVGNLTALGFWFQMEQQFNWYVPAILVLYFLSPLFHHLIEKYREKSLFVYAALFVVIVSGFRSNLLIALTRFPTYFLGMYFGFLYIEKKTPKKSSVAVWWIIGIAAMAAVPYIYIYHHNILWYYGMYWLPFVIAAPFWTDIITKALHLQEKFGLGRLINRFWDFIGARSFEIYLCHLAVYNVCLRLGFHSWGAWVCIAAIGTLTGICYHEVVVFCQKQYKNRKTKKLA